MVDVVDDVRAPVLAQLSGEHLTAGMGDLLADADRQALGRGDESDVFAAAIRHAMSAGNDGYVDDDLAFVTDWGFRRPRGTRTSDDLAR